MSDEPHLPDIHRLFRRAEQWFEEGRVALHEQIPCREGCTQCCHGVFAVTALDRIHMQQGLRLLPSATRDMIEEKAQAQASLIQKSFPRLMHLSCIDTLPDDEIDQLVAHFDQLPCPALDDRGSCLIYRHRPVTCRMMGLPVEHDGLVEGACDVQTSVPLVRLSDIARQRENDIAKEEAILLSECKTTTAETGEEFLLPYAFLGTPVA